jgi:hypothetical protein
MLIYIFTFVGVNIVYIIFNKCVATNIYYFNDQSAAAEKKGNRKF